jgi:hypothetical protein
MQKSKKEFIVSNRINRQHYRISEITDQYRIPEICGTLSACFALEYLGFNFDINQIIKDAKDGSHFNGADAFSLGYAISKNPNLKVILNIDYDKRGLDANDKDSISKFYSNKNTKENKSISIEKVLRRYTNVSIPLVAFWRNGDSKLDHFSPLVGKTNEGLHFILDDKVGKILPQIDEFLNRNWWNDTNGRTSIIIRKRGLINFIKYHFYVTCNYLQSVK